jgi:hypothetical protein
VAVGSGPRRRRSWRQGRPRASDVHLGDTPRSQPLLHAVDHGAPVVVPPQPYVAASREGGWGPHLDPFLARNQAALHSLALEPRIIAGREGVRLELQPGGRAGAVPLCSAVTGQVAGGMVVAPRFGWPGVGRVLSVTGWGSGPEFLAQPLVPGSGREVPPWVLAGPALHRLAELLAHLRLGYRERTEVRRHPRGQIQWSSYVSRQLPSGKWHHLPCRFSELETDSRLRQAVRWTLERLRNDLTEQSTSDLVAILLTALARQLLEQVADVPARRPNRGELDPTLMGGAMASAAFREGLRAIGWIVDERGLGGGRSSDGLAWCLPLEQLWERYVEAVYRAEATRTGGKLRVGRLGETTIPLPWSDPLHRSLGHLVPDAIIRRPDSIQIVDAKYKAHFADLDATRWHQFTEEMQAAHRADIHQILAYAAAYGDAPTVQATLVYPVPQRLATVLADRGQDRSTAILPVGQRTITLELRALPFGPIEAPFPDG